MPTISPWVRPATWNGLGVTNCEEGGRTFPIYQAVRDFSVLQLIVASCVTPTWGDQTGVEWNCFFEVDLFAVTTLMDGSLNWNLHKGHHSWQCHMFEFGRYFCQMQALRDLGLLPELIVHLWGECVNHYTMEAPLTRVTYFNVCHFYFFWWKNKAQYNSFLPILLLI